MAKIPYITEEQVKKYMDIDELYRNLERAFGNISKGEAGGIKQPVRASLTVPNNNGWLGVMPAYSEQDNAMVTKFITNFPQNQGIPTHVALIVVFSPENGTVLALMEGETITAVRTALASAVATKYLASPDSKILAILGAGVQARSHITAFRRFFKYDEIRVWNRTLSRAEELAKELGGIKVCATIEEAVRDADVICVVTGTMTPILMADWVKPSAHINSVGAPRPTAQELDPQLVTSSLVYCDSRPACMSESGDIIISKVPIFAEIGEVINGTKEAFPHKLTVFKSVGLAVEDVVAAKMVYDKFIKSE